jgi:hypothetical protein
MKFRGFFLVCGAEHTIPNIFFGGITLLVINGGWSVLLQHIDILQSSIGMLTGQWYINRDPNMMVLWPLLVVMVSATNNLGILANRSHMLNTQVASLRESHIWQFFKHVVFQWEIEDGLTPAWGVFNFVPQPYTTINSPHRMLPGSRPSARDALPVCRRSPGRVCPRKWAGCHPIYGCFNEKMRINYE